MVYDVNSANYTILDFDNYSVINVTTGASDRTITLPTLSANVNRTITIKKVDTGDGSVIIAPEGAETIDGYSDLYLGLDGQYLTIYGGSSEWKKISGHLQPVLSEPAQGELHWLPQSTATTAHYFLNSITTTAAWVSFTTSYPVGTKSALVSYLVQAVSSAAGLARHRVCLDRKSVV